MFETGFRPLYQQVREVLVQRIVGGDWAPGEALPSEQALAGDLGVSQGTVRKALDALAGDGVVERRQGKGTFVTEQTPERSLFHFFRLSTPDGERLTPAPLSESIRRRAATAAERRRLDLGAGAEAYVVDRVRAIEGRPASVETIVLPAALTPGLPDKAPLPNALYSFYQSDYKISIVSADEQIRAVAANRAEAAKLRVEPGAPLLRVERVAVDLDGRKVELRTSRFLTADRVYAISLR